MMYIYIKFIFDRLFSGLLLLIFSPLILLFAVLVFLTDFSNPFFIQSRIGLNGKLFNMYKIRSMSPNSSHKHSGYYTYEDDPRILWIGHFIRKYSIDELPQLLNILKSDMSFIGPRPAIHDEFVSEDISPQLEYLIAKRTSIRPGLTGLAQVILRNQADWNQKLMIDKKYLSSIGGKQFRIDIMIIFKTIHSLIHPHGIYDNK